MYFPTLLSTDVFYSVDFIIVLFSHLFFLFLCGSFLGLFVFSLDLISLAIYGVKV
jgi:hypothetical protein